MSLKNKSTGKSSHFCTHSLQPHGHAIRGNRCLLQASCDIASPVFLSSNRAGLMLSLNSTIHAVQSLNVGLGLLIFISLNTLRFLLLKRLIHQ